MAVSHFVSFAMMKPDAWVTISSMLGVPFELKPCVPPLTSVYWMSARASLPFVKRRREFSTERTVSLSPWKQ